MSFHAVLGLGAVLGASPTAAQEPQDSREVVVVCKDADGRPVAGAEVHLFQHFSLPEGGGEYRAFGPYRSDGEGRARCEVALTYDGGRYDRLAYARVPGRLVGGGRSSRSEPGSGAGSTVEVRLVRSRTLGGRVNVPAGSDPRAVRVRVLSMYALDGREIHGGRDHGTPLARSSARGLERILPEVFDCAVDADGVFALRDVPVEARVYLACEAPGLGQAQWANIDRGPTPLPDRVEIDMVVEAVLAGRLAGPAGAPRAGTVVRIRATGRGRGERGPYVLTEFRTEADAEGRFRLGGLPGAEYELRAEPADAAWTARPQFVSVDAGERRTNVEVELDRAIEVKGVVVEAGTGKPIERALVTALAHGELEMGSSASDAQGRFALRLPPGEAQLYFGAVPAGYSYPDPQIVARIEVGAARAPLRLELERDGRD